MDKLAEEILNKYNHSLFAVTRKDAIMAMQSYHEAKLKENKPDNFDSLMTHDKETIARWYLDFLNGNVTKEQLLQYKIWENIFGSEYNTVETLIEGYFEYLKTRTNG